MNIFLENQIRRHQTLLHSGRLVDTKQDIIFVKDSEWVKNKIGPSWYSLSNKG